MFSPQWFLQRDCAVAGQLVLIRSVAEPLLRFEEHIAGAENVNVLFAVVQAAEIAPPGIPRRPPLIEFRSSGKGSQDGRPAGGHIPVAEIQPAFPYQLEGVRLLLAQRLFK